MLTDHSTDAKKQTMTPFRTVLELFLSAIIFLFLNSVSQAAQDVSSYTPPEVATATLSCKAEWNQFCEDQKTIKVPEGHKLCKNTVTAKEQTGDSSYEIVSTDSHGVTVKFHAKGNRDRVKQQGASILLNISLLGVREHVDCVSGVTAKPATTPAAEPNAVVVAEKKPAPTIEKTAEIATPTPAAKTAVATPQEAKPDACACSQWIDADKVFNCLANGHGRENAKCDSYATTIQCVTSKDECRESQKENCPQIAGLNQTTSKKRIFVPNSPYCQQP